MYSIVMMAALAPAADTPVAPKVADPVPAVALGGCSGSGVSYGSCSGGGISYGSCHGSGGHRRILGGHRAACHGGGYSCSGYNCFGAAHSCFGSAGVAGYGTSYGSTWGPPIGMPPYTLHGYNAGGVWGAGPPVVPAYADAGHGYGPNLPPVMNIPVAPPTKGSDGAPVGANIKFVVPADAKLYVDGKLTPGTGTERTFYTPPLAAGQFYYEVKVETTVAGKPVVEEKKIIVTAGANLTEKFGGAAVAGR
jgi:uncharacterized protein (TIGR03000 family)